MYDPRLFAHGRLGLTTVRPPEFRRAPICIRESMLNEYGLPQSRAFPTAVISGHRLYV